MKSDEVLLLSSGEVRNLLTLDECIGAVERAFRAHGEQKVVPPAVLSMHVERGGFHVKAGMLTFDRSYFAAKVNGNFPQNSARFALPTIQGVVILFDAGNGTPLAVMDSRDITSLRTAAATAVAARFLARPESRIVTICGCGNQGRVQLRALSSVRPIEVAFAYDEEKERALCFARDMATELGLSIQPVDSLGEAARQSDICVTCTTSREAILLAESVSPGIFIAAVGADNPQKQELHPNVMVGAKIVCDLVDQCAVMGDLHHALDAGLVTRADVHAELGEIVAGKKAGRESPEEITIFDSTGIALQDVAAAAILYEKAQRQGLGVRLSFAA
jgi:alanine dehydrogenase